MSKLEDKFVEYWSKHGIGKIPERQYRFSPTRKFRFDFAWPNEMVAVEIDGLGPGHAITRNVGVAIAALSNSNERQNHAVELGWLILRYTARQLSSEEKRRKCIDQIKNVLKQQRYRTS